MNQEEQNLQCCLQQRFQTSTGDCDTKYASHLSPECKPLLIQHCRERENAFSPNCVEFLHNLISDAPETVELITRDVCYQNTHQACSCVNAQVPAGVTNPKAQKVYKCLSTECNDPINGGWNPYDCQNSFTECEILDPNIFQNKSEVERIEIANQCGQICVGDSCNTTSVPTLPPPPQKVVIPKFVSTVVIVSVALILVTIVIIVMTSLTTGKKTKQIK